MERTPTEMGQDRMLKFRKLRMIDSEYSKGMLLTGIYSVENNSRVALQKIRSVNSDASYTEATYRADVSGVETDEEWLLFCRGLGL